MYFFIFFHFNGSRGRWLHKFRFFEVFVYLVIRNNRFFHFAFIYLFNFFLFRLFFRIVILVILIIKNLTFGAFVIITIRSVIVILIILNLALILLVPGIWWHLSLISWRLTGLPLASLPIWSLLVTLTRRLLWSFLLNIVSGLACEKAKRLRIYKTLRRKQN